MFVELIFSLNSLMYTEKSESIIDQTPDNLGFVITNLAVAAACGYIIFTVMNQKHFITLYLY